MPELVKYIIIFSDAIFVLIMHKYIYSGFNNKIKSTLSVVILKVKKGTIFKQLIGHAKSYL